MEVNFSDICDHDIAAEDKKLVNDNDIIELVFAEINKFDAVELNYFMTRLVGPMAGLIIHLLIKKGAIKIC